MDVNTQITGDTYMAQTIPVQEAVDVVWDGIEFVEDHPTTEAAEPEPHPELEIEYQDVEYLIFSLITSHNKEPLETSLRCQHCGRSNLIYFIHQWDKSRVYRGRRYALTELLCPKCGSGRVHALYGHNDIEYYYLGIKDD